MITPLPPSPGELSVIEIAALLIAVCSVGNATYWYVYRTTFGFAMMIWMFAMLFIVVCS